MLSLDTSRHPAGWTANDMADETGWVETFGADDRAAIVDLSRRLARDGVASDAIGKGLYDGTPLHRRLSDIGRDLESGRGFVLFRDFPLDALSFEEACYGYVAIGRYFGKVVAQNPKGDVVGKVTDLAKDWTKDATARGYQTRMHMDFHSDSCDVVGLLCVNPAKSGGLSAIVSSVAIYNHLRASEPEVAEVLCNELYYDRRGEQVGGNLPFYATATFHEKDGRVFNRYCRQYIESAQRFSEVPRLTAAQITAMDRFDALCHDEKFILHMDFRRGDIQFLNNHVILHSRTAFEDYEEPERKRLLLRLYVNNKTESDRPDCYRERFSDPEKWALAALSAR